MNAEQFETIFQALRKSFDLSDCSIISTEGTLKSLVDQDKVEQLQQVGFNRVSFGVQSLNKEIRKQVGVKYGDEQLWELCDKLKKHGIENFNADLMGISINQKIQYNKISTVPQGKTMTNDLFGSLFELQDSRVDRLGNPLVELDEMIDWDGFRKILKRVNKIQIKGKAGAKPKDVVMMFKGLVIQNLYGLSDDQLEYQIEDRRSFQRFIGFNNHHRAPDAKTFWSFRNRLTELKLVEPLFNQLTQQLNAAGFVARKGQIVDASIVPAPIQRNSREENEKVKKGEIPEGWSDNKASQKDSDARWTKKNGKSHYGYKNHISVDNKNKLIRHYDVTDASVHDSNVFEALLDPENTNADVWADSAYRSQEKEGKLADLGYRSQVSQKGKRNAPLSETKQKANRKKSKVPSRVEPGRVEHIFGAQSNLRKKAIRSIGIARAQTEIGMMNVVYNMMRYCFLSRVSAS